MRFSSAILFALSAVSAVVASPVELEKRSEATDVAASWGPAFKAWNSALAAYPSGGLQAITSTGSRAVEAVTAFDTLSNRGPVSNSDIPAIARSFESSLPALESALTLLTQKKNAILAAGPPDNKYLFQGYIYGIYASTNYIFDKLSRTSQAPYPQQFKELQAQVKPELDAAFGAYFAA